ncbi:MATE family efflux transporter [Neobacillus cucumis]|uniref:MATE family efflux transporter n=1 Tax=Neobacillus cucumis TaxID=1740721 RepID=UPI002040E8EF|nr:MATE family efflux transporter [Neobacillus cucumis]MCM3728331.1 MATE family efflux transporter [Neobacillus cucumis]
MGNSIDQNHRNITLLAITWPIFVELLLQMIMGSTDTIMLSHISDDIVAAVGVANQLVFFCILIFSFTATGTAVLISQYLGAGLRVDVKKAAAISLSINLFIGLIVSCLMIIFKGPLLDLFHLKDHLASIGYEYLSVVGGTLFLQAILVTVSSILRANGFTREVMFVSISMNVIHVMSNSIVIYGLFGFPEMGVKGVAFSTAFSRASALAIGFILMYKRLPVTIKRQDYLNFDWTIIKKILKVGIPAAGEQISYNTSQMAMTAITAMLGAAALSTRVYTWNIMSFIMLFGLALGQGTQILIGYRVGAGNYEDAYRQLYKSLKPSFVISIFISILIALFRKDLISLFTHNKEIIETGSTLLLLCLILEPGRTLNLIGVNSLRATGDAAFTVKMGVLSMWGLAVPISYILGIHFGLGLAGVWTAFIVDEWFRGIVMFFRWKSRVWEKKVLVVKQKAKAVSS